MTQKTANDEAVSELNSCLRGEISAVETYRMALDKVDRKSIDALHSASLERLSGMMEDHGRAAQRLRERIRQLGGEASDSSGAWGTWAKTVQGAADLLGDRTAIKSLKEGEEHGLKLYESAMGKDALDASTRALATELMGQQRQHIRLLDSMLEQV